RCRRRYPRAERRQAVALSFPHAAEESERVLATAQFRTRSHDGRCAGRNSEPERFRRRPACGKRPNHRAQKAVAGADSRALSDVNGGQANGTLRAREQSTLHAHRHRDKLRRTTIYDISGGAANVVLIELSSHERLEFAEARFHEKDRRAI